MTPVSLLFATDPSECARNSLICNRSGKQGGGTPPANSEITKAGNVKRVRSSEQETA